MFTLGESGESQNEAMTLDFTIGNASAIDSLNAEMKSADGKLLQNGKVVIVKNHVKYNLNGERQ